MHLPLHDDGNAGTKRTNVLVTAHAGVDFVPLAKDLLRISAEHARGRIWISWRKISLQPHLPCS